MATKLLALALAFLGGCATAALEKLPDTQLHWCAEERPAHVVVSDALPEECQVAVCEAVVWWSTQGVGYLTCAVVPDSSLTPGYPNPLFIQAVTTPPENPAASGDTRIHRITAECIDGAEMRFEPRYCNGGNTQAHELGHALGLDHVDDPHNLMWPASLPGERALTPEQLRAVR